MAQADHVVIINDTSMPKGGAGMLAVALALRLAKAGRRVTFFAGDDGVNPEFESAGINVVAIGGKTLLESRRDNIANGIFNIKAKRALARWIADNDGANIAYHVHAWSQILSPSIFSALRPVAARTAITAHDFFLACPNGNYTIYPKSTGCDHKPMSLACMACNCDKRNYAHKLWRVARQASLNSLLNFKTQPFSVVAIHAGMIAFLERGGIVAKRISVTPNPAERLRETRVRAEENDEIFFLGRLDHEKGADLLAAAARRAGMGVRIIGEGPDVDAVKRAHPGAIFDGWRDKSEIAKLFAKARLLAMPSRCLEPFGLAAAEALKVGVPVIASQTALIAGDLEHLGMGRCVDVFDEDAFAALLASLATDDGAVRSMSESAFANAGKIALSYDDWTGRHLEMYDRFIVEGRRARQDQALSGVATKDQEYVQA